MCSTLPNRDARATPLACLTVIAWLVAAGQGVAQTTPPPPAPTPPPQEAPPVVAASSPRKPGRWMFEIHGGAFGDLLGSEPSGTAIDAFPAGPSFTTAGGHPSRAVPSWFYGDGPVLFDEMRQSFTAVNGVAIPAITPLDVAMRTRGTTRKPRPAFGGRVSANVTSWLGLELAVDHGPSRAQLSSDVLAGLEATRSSYTSAFEALLATIPQNGGRVTTTATASPEASGTQTIATASLVLSLVRVGRLGIHTVLGGGYIVNDSQDFEVRLGGGYQFSLLSRFPINESETVTIRYAERKRMPAAVAGLGVTVRVAGQSGLRVDARVLASESRTTTTVDSAATRVVAPQPVAFPSLTTPSIQFSTLPGARSSLSGEAVNGLVTFSGGGRQYRPHVTVGYYIRF